MNDNDKKRIEEIKELAEDLSKTVIQDYGGVYFLETAENLYDAGYRKVAQITVIDELHEIPTEDKTAIKSDDKIKIKLEVSAEKCPYWNYENQTCRHTCKGCEELPKGNTIETVQCGVMIDGNRYCMLEVDIYGTILTTINK